MNSDRTFKTLSIVAIVLAVAGLSIAYAAFSTTLNINGTATVKGGQWSILFQNASTATALGGATVTNQPSITASTTYTFDVTVYKPGDGATFTVDVHNAGQLDAKLDSFTLTGVSDAAAKDITYTVTYSNGNAIAANDTLTAGETKTLLVTVTWDSTSETVPEQDTTLNLGGTLVYVQA